MKDVNAVDLENLVQIIYALLGLAVRNDHGVCICMINVFLYAAGAVSARAYTRRQSAHAERCVLDALNHALCLLGRVYVGHLYAHVAQIQILQNLDLLILSDTNERRDVKRFRCTQDAEQLLTVDGYMLGIEYKEIETGQRQHLDDRRIGHLYKCADCALAVFNFLFE